MARYQETAAEARKIVDRLVEDCSMNEDQVRDLAYLLNLIVRCSPRAVQSTVRRNIVQIAMGPRVLVDMTKEVDEKTQREYNKIHITPRSQV